jgi:hypothetical protein
MAVTAISAVSSDESLQQWMTTMDNSRGIVPENGEIAYL